MSASAPPLNLPPFYAILDPEQIRDRSVETVLSELLAGGVKVLQLRVKAMAPRDFLRLARQTRVRTREYNCCLIVNDRVDIALACDADGVHLGQEDLPMRSARKLMGQKTIGISTHDISQAQEAERTGADYIGFGPVFATATKDTGYSARGLDKLREIRKAVQLPIVAIGGITESNVTSAWQAGADGAAIISDILSANDIVSKVKRILALYPIL
jgi:thiamine-phosphate pyrophosphorylase